MYLDDINISQESMRKRKNTSIEKLARDADQELHKRISKWPINIEKDVQHRKPSEKQKLKPQ